MNKYIALLRGINVGGKNKIVMAELRKAFEENGFMDVKTYMNSGNIIFNSPLKDEKALKEICELIISEQFKLNIPVTIISREYLEKAINHAPSWWDSNKEAKHNTIFVIPPETVENIAATIGSIKLEYEKVDYYGNVIFWSAPIRTFSKTRWSKVASTPVYKSITIRNANTTKKLLQLLQE